MRQKIIDYLESFRLPEVASEERAENREKVKTNDSTNINSEVEKLKGELAEWKRKYEEAIEKHPEQAFNAVNGNPCFTSTQMGILMYAVGNLIEGPKNPGKTTIGEIVEKISGYSAKTVSQNMKGEFRKNDIDAIADAIESKFPKLAEKIRHL